MACEREETFPRKVASRRQGDSTSRRNFLASFTTSRILRRGAKSFIRTESIM